MRVSRFAVPGIVALLIQAVCAGAAPTTDAQWKELLAKLASDDFATRAAAQAELDAIDWRSLDDLKRYASLEKDPEAAARIAARITDINEAAVYDPIPISLSVEDATLSEVSVALGKALGLAVEPAAAPAAERFTLKAVDEPLWEVYRKLNNQYPLTLQSASERFRLFRGGAGAHRMQVSGPVAIIPQTITRTRRVELNNPREGGLELEMLGLSYLLMVDPRVRISSYRQVHFTHALDEDGRNLLPNLPPVTVETSQRNPMLMLSSNLQLEPSIRPGTLIKSLKGSFTFKAIVGEEVVTIDDAAKHFNQPIKVANSTVKVTRLDLRENFISVAVSRLESEERAGQPTIPLTIEILDATDQRLSRYVLSAVSISGGFSGQTFALPLKMRFTLPSKLKEVTFPFELKDLRIP